MARLFTASTDTIKTTTGAPTASDNFTMFSMVNPRDFGAAQVMQFIGHGVDSGAGYGVRILTTGQIQVDVSFVAGLNSGLYAKVGRWNAVAVVRRATVWMVFLNGIKSSVTITNNPFAIDTDYVIGSTVNSSSTSSSPIRGALANVAFWNVALKDRELFDLTSFKVLPNKIQRQSLTHFHPLKDRPWGSTEFGFVGANMTRTGTHPYTHPVIPPRLNIYYLAGLTSMIKTILGLAKGSVKTVNGLPIASVKSYNGLQ